MELGDFNPPDGSFSNIAALAVDDDGVYVVTQASEASFTMDRVQIYRVPPCGGSATLLGSRTTPAMTGGTYGALAASQRVFVVMGDGVYSVPTSGGPMTTETTSSVLFNAQVAVYGNQFYWIDSSATLWGLATGGGGVPREQHDGAQQRDTCPIQGKSGDASEEHPEIHEGEDAQDERVHEARVYVTWPPLLLLRRQFGGPPAGPPDPDFPRGKTEDLSGTHRGAGWSSA
jgi:hypothetical protein